MEFGCIINVRGFEMNIKNGYKNRSNPLAIAVLWFSATKMKFEADENSNLLWYFFNVAFCREILWLI